jgi:iduronate 2-sulfatase
VDDLRPELGAYGLANRHTPNIDKLASGGTVFERTYTQQAICGPSRNSFLSGRRPDSSRTWNFINHFREDHPEWTSVPGLFVRDPHAVAVGSGKSYHPKMPPQYDGSKSWSPLSVPLQNPCWNTAGRKWIPDKWQDGGLPCVPCLVDIKHYTVGGNISVANEFCATDAEEDTQTVNHAIDLLRQVADQHFYLAVGMHKPHIPWQYAQEDLDKHPLENIDLPRQRVPPVNVPAIALQTSDKEAKDVGGAFHSSPYKPLDDDETRQARRQYRAATTGMDRKVGKLLDELDALGLTNTTAVILHADHGWHLGDEGEWRKFTNFETDTRVPLIIRAPWLSSGARAAGLVELVDLAPTIAELAGVSLPTNETPFEGISLVPMLKNPKAEVKQAAFSQYPRHATHKDEMYDFNAAHHVERSNFTHMGYTVRTDQWRYTEWRAWNGTTLTPMWDALFASELYDHRNEVHYPTNFDAGEAVNLAGQSDYADVVASHSKLIRAMFDASYIDTERLLLV